MNLSNSVDIVIPSFRLDVAVLAPIIHLKRPAGWCFNLFLIVDNPNIAVPPIIREWENEGKIQLILNKKNEGPAETRNVGIRAGQGKWILFLDDDIMPAASLLDAYVTAIQNDPEAIGFVGVTRFPEAMNNVTKALSINGSVVHFDMALREKDMVWAPTANIMLNRFKMHNDLFNASLKNGGEDIEFLARSSFQFGEKYISVPNAVVSHPWWNDGQVQTERMFRYGKGAADIMDLPAIKKYTYYDFTNTGETLLLLLLATPFAIYYGCITCIFKIAIAAILAEFITNWIKAVKVGKTFSPTIAFYLMWAKNCYEFGVLYANLAQGKWNHFAKRIDVGFTKEHPSHFRTNKWKIIKMIVLLVLGLGMFCIRK